MDESPENSTALSATDMETLDYLRGVKSSTCLLLSTTPSPTSHDLKHPLSEELNDQPFLALNSDPNAANEQADASAGDSSSSGDSNSVVQDPVSAQLINNISMLDYQTLSKNGDLIIGQAEDSKLNGNLKIKNRKLPSFVNWNWGIIRKVLLWIVLSGLIACLGTIIAMVVTIPKECNPDLPWFQGKVFYEVFPASFKDSNNDGTGDLKGLIKKLDYIHDLGVSAIRLNYIFKTDRYPENYNNITSLIDIDRSIGVLKDLEDLITEVHNRNISLILDIPIYSMVKIGSSSNATQSVIIPNESEDKYLDQTSQAIKYWAQRHNVDGFYLKNLERFVDDINFGRSLQIWKQMIGNGKILIANEKAYNEAKGDALNVLLSRIDLIDIHLDIHEGTLALKEKIDKVVAGTLWAKPYYPWVHWNIGNVNSERISTKHENNTLTLTVLEFVLPGTVSVFYGDEVGLGGLQKNQIEGDFPEHKDIHNLVPMTFSNNEKTDNMNILPWNSKSVLEPNYTTLDIVKNLIKIRLETPTIYLKGTYKEGHLLKNMEIRKTEENLVVIERWYPRRNTCVLVANFGNKSITTDLSSMFYGGTIIAGSNSSQIGQVIYFDKVSFLPNSAIILKLEK
ncbi:hypothetical protein O3G_MSEX013568 [Manduca sexta]|uniref:Glycosyl hydrolase family 13 catalytic domain-containing protein n=1 Tax=Manduca sexta TaxID=7130 RepID=A0A921ZU54_MANSE|nr:hypothetical protein O3G_MSEX013568 [Manduca sexta]